MDAMNSVTFLFVQNCSRDTEELAQPSDWLVDEHLPGISSKVQRSQGSKELKVRGAVPRLSRTNVLSATFSLGRKRKAIIA